MKTLKEICIEHGVRSKEQEYVRLLTIEWLKENKKPEPNSWNGSFNMVIKELLEDLEQK